MEESSENAEKLNDLVHGFSIACLVVHLVFSCCIGFGSKLEKETMKAGTVLFGIDTLLAIIMGGIVGSYFVLLHEAKSDVDIVI